MTNETSKQAALAGRMHSLPAPSSSIIRVFISSTFTDMILERNALMENAYPRVKDFCRKHGLEFQVVDMRWGIREEAQDDHIISCLCRKEIRKCQRLSAGPTFVVILGQKYGYRPFPSTIAADEYDLLRAVLMDSGKDCTEMDKWFKRDDNAKPANYCLLPISTFLPNYNNKEDTELQEKARAEWQKIFGRLQDLLREGATICYNSGRLNQQQRDLYFISVTEDEIQEGLLQDDNKCRQFCLIRDIADLDNNLDDRQMHKYVDVLPKNAIDHEARTLHAQLKSEKIPCALKFNSDVIRTFSVDWCADEGINSNIHQDYLSQLCDSFYNMITNQIKSTIASRNDIVKDGLLAEVIQHLTLAKTRCDTFIGRERVLAHIKDFLQSNKRTPLVLHGTSGCGKTSLLAKIALDIPEFDDDPVIILRFLGTTPHSSGIYKLLRSCCQQIAVNYNRQLEEVPDDFQTMIAYFWRLIEEVPNKTKSLYIILDSLDQLNSGNHAHQMTWLPLQLPEHAHLIVSTLPDAYDILPTLNTLIPNGYSFVEVPALGKSASINLFRRWLELANRTITDSQYAVVQQALCNCSLPLYARLIFEDVSQWKSFQTIDSTRLHNTICGVIDKLFERTETYHGKILVSHALAYITASRCGLSEVELEDVLSLDDTVLDEVFIFWVSPIRRLPPLLWKRIRDDLSSYLVEREANGVTVIAWYHRQFKEVASQRYMSNKEFRVNIHSSLADYFLGVWSGGKKKPFQYAQNLCQRLGLNCPNGVADRKVPCQPLKWSADSVSDDNGHFNLRKLSELPYQLFKSGRMEELWDEVLFNYTWLHSKFVATSLPEVMDDFLMVREFTRDPRVELLAAVLGLSGSAINRMPETLASELSTRLQPFSNDHPVLQTLMQQCKQNGTQDCALVPVVQYLDQPLESHLHCFDGHHNSIADVVFSSDSSIMNSVSIDGRIIIWDVVNGEQIRMINATFCNPSIHASLFQVGNMLVYDANTADSSLCIYNCHTGQILHKIAKRSNQYLHNTTVIDNHIAYDGQLINTKTGLVEKILPFTNTSKRHFVFAITSNMKYILVGYQKNTDMIDLCGGAKLASFPHETPPCKIIITHDDQVVVIGYSDSYLIRCFNIDLKSKKFATCSILFDFSQSIEDVLSVCTDFHCNKVTEMTVRNEKLLINIRFQHLFVFNLSTQKVDKMDIGLDEEKIQNSAFSFDESRVVATMGTKLCLWNAHTGNLLSAMKLPGSGSGQYQIVIAPTKNIAATFSTFNHSIRLWDLDKVCETRKDRSHVYSSPVDTIAVAPYTNLVFVKFYCRQQSNNSWNLHDRFGIDVWNLSTETRRTLLPYGSYGNLRNLKCSLDGSIVVMHVSTKSSDIVYAVDCLLGSLILALRSKTVTTVQLSLNKEYLITEEVQLNKTQTVRLFSIKTGAILNEFENCRQGTFTTNSTYMLCTKAGQFIVVYNIALSQISDFKAGSTIDRLQAIPKRPDILLVTTKTHETARITMFNHQTQSQLWCLDGVAPNGILSIAKNGKWAVDGYMQRFNLITGEVFKTCDKTPKTEGKLTKFTYCGCHIVWADNEPTDCLNVCQISQNKTIGRVSTHSPVTSLALVNYGYTVVIGCDDGHLLIYEIHIPESKSKSNNPKSTDNTQQKETHQSRKNGDFGPNPRLIAGFDAVFQPKSRFVHDSNLPQIAETVRGTLQNNARFDPQIDIAKNQKPN